PARPQAHAATNVVTDLLPYCTHPPMNTEQVIGLSDAAGSLRDVVLLVLRAGAGDSMSADSLVAAVGFETAENMVEFFREEWVAD
ncbi:hypothetical protein K504DRAFT_338284, partial [Pleomassaria siparia CBS 279.74]